MDTMKRYLRPPTVAATPMLATAILAFAAALGLSVLAYTQQASAIAYMQRSERLVEAQAARPAPKMSRAALEEKKRWDGLKAEREFAWGPLFLAVEKAADKNIELLEVAPDKASRRVVLRGEARNQDALVTYLGVLAAQPALKNVHLTHQLKETRERLETWSFEIRATIAE